MLFLTHMSWASDEQCWQAALAACDGKDYVLATTSLLSVKNHNAALFMMLSDCYEHLGKPVIAAMYKQKAFFYSSWRQKWRLLEQQYKVHSNKAYPLSQFLLDASKSFCLSIPWLLLQLLFILLLFLLLFSSWHRKVARFFLIISLVMMSCCAIWKHSVYQPHGIVLIDTSVRNFADEAAPVITQLQQGTVVYYTKEKNGFYQLKQPYGWVKIDDLGLIIER